MELCVESAPIPSRMVNHTVIVSMIKALAMKAQVSPKSKFLYLATEMLNRKVNENSAFILHNAGGKSCEYQNSHLPQ